MTPTNLADGCSPVRLCLYGRMMMIFLWFEIPERRLTRRLECTDGSEHGYDRLITVETKILGANALGLRHVFPEVCHAIE